MLEKDILKKTKQLLTEHEEEITKLREILRKEGGKTLEGRKFVGYNYDHYRGRIISYR